MVESESYLSPHKVLGESFMLWLHIQTATQAATQAPPPSNNTSELVKGLAAGALGLIGTLATVVVGWLKDRDISATRLRELDEASKRVAFWDAWFKAISPLASETDCAGWKESAKGQIMLASASIEALFKPDSAKFLTGLDAWKIRRQEFPWWKRWFLFYKPPRPRAWIPRVIFYMYLFVALLDVTLFERARFAEWQYNRAEITDSLKSSTDNHSPYFIKQRQIWQDELLKLDERETESDLRMILLIASGVGVSLLFRMWSVYLEKPAETKVHPEQFPPPPSAS